MTALLQRENIFSESLLVVEPLLCKSYFWIVVSVSNACVFPLRLIASQAFFFMNIISFFLIEKSFLSSFCRMGIIALIKLRPHPWKDKCFQVGLCYFSPNPTFPKLCLRYYLNSAATKVFSFPGTYILLLGILRGTSLLTALAAQSLFHVSVFFGFMIEMFPPFSCLYSPTGCCPSTPTSLVFAQNILLCTSPSPCSSSLSWIAMLLSKHFDKPNITSSIPKAI